METLSIPARRSGPRPKLAAEKVARPRIVPIDVVTECLNRKGWRNSGERKATKRKGEGKQVFMSRFTNLSFMRKTVGESDLWPQVVVSSADANVISETVRIRIGLYDSGTEDVFICPTDTPVIGKLTTEEEVETAIAGVLDRFMDVFKLRAEMESHKVTPNDCQRFAQKAIYLRVTKEDGTVKPSELLYIKEEKQTPANLWDLYRLVRVNLLDGNFHHAGGRYARNLTAILPELTIGEELWAMAEEMMTSPADSKKRKGE
jgi:hypothetical protein